jgi:hypothetical protein
VLPLSRALSSLDFASKLSAAEGRVNGAVTAMAGIPPGTDAVELKSKIVYATMPLYTLQGAGNYWLSLYDVVVRLITTRVYANANTQPP